MRRDANVPFRHRPEAVRKRHGLDASQLLEPSGAHQQLVGHVCEQIASMSSGPRLLVRIAVEELPELLARVERLRVKHLTPAKRRHPRLEGAVQLNRVERRPSVRRAVHANIEHERPRLGGLSAADWKPKPGVARR